MPLSIHVLGVVVHPLLLRLRKGHANRVQCKGICLNAPKLRASPSPSARIQRAQLGQSVEVFQPGIADLAVLEADSSRRLNAVICRSASSPAPSSRSSANTPVTFVNKSSPSNRRSHAGPGGLSRARLVVVSDYAANFIIASTAFLCFLASSILTPSQLHTTAQRVTKARRPRRLNWYQRSLRFGSSFTLTP